MNKFRLSLAVCLCGIAHTFPATAQEQPRDGGYFKALVYQQLDNDGILRQLESRFVQLDSLLYKAPLSASFEWERRSDSSGALDSLWQARRNDEIAAFRRKTGLELTGQIYQRLDNSLGFDEEDGYSRYATKFQGELGWNIFNSSVLQRKSQTRRIELSNAIGRLDMEKSQIANEQAVTETALREWYNRRLAVVMYHRLVNIDLLNMAYQYALEQDKISNDKLFDVMDDKMDLEYALLQTCPTDSIQSEPLMLPDPVILTVDAAKLFESLESKNADLQAGLLKEELLDVQGRLTNYAHQMRVTPFVRYSHYLRTDAPSSTNVDLGVRFTFPLYDDSSAKRRALRTEKIIAGIDRQSTGDKVKARCNLLLDQLDKLNKTVRTETQHLKQISDYIGIRRKAYENSPQGYNYIARIEEYNSYLKSVERLYRLLLARDLCILDIQKTAGYGVPVVVER